MTDGDGPAGDADSSTTDGDGIAGGAGIPTRDGDEPAGDAGSSTPDDPAGGRPESRPTAATAGPTARRPARHRRALASTADRLERSALLLATLATVAVLAVVFYYPVATVLVEAVRQAGRLTLDPLLSVLRDPFYFGAAHGLFADPAAVPGDVASWLATGLGSLGIAWTGGPVPIRVLYEFPPVRLGLFGFTAYQALLSTVASVALGLPGAYLLSRFEFPGRRLLRSLTILPFVLPSIMVAVGFLAMFGRTGVFNDVLGAVGLDPVDLVFTLQLVVLAHAFYNAPLVTRLVTAAWEGVDGRQVETARSLGAGRLRAFRDVVAPQLLPSLLTAALLTFIFTFMTFPIVLALGGLQLATVEVWLYARVQQLDLAEAATLATLETALSLGLTYLYLRYEARQVAAREASPLPRKRPWPVDRGPVRVAERVGLLAYAAVALVVFVGPMASLVIESVTTPEGAFTTAYYEFLLAQQGAEAVGTTRPLPAIRNSLVFGGATLLVAVPMGVVVAVLSTRRFRGRKVADAILMAPLAVSGIVVGLGLLQGLVFGTTLFGHRITVTGWAAIVAAHAVAAYPFVTRNLSPQLGGVDRRLVESARTLGATRVRALLDVELPLVAPALLAGAAFAFAISVGEFDSTVILAEGATSYTMPVALERYIGNRSLGPSLGPATAMGTVLLFVTAVSFVVIDRLGGRWQA